MLSSTSSKRLPPGRPAGIFSTLAVCFLMGIDWSASLITKSVTAPVAMNIAEQIGGAPSLAAVFAVLTGMTGATLGPWLLIKLNVHSAMVRGLAMGTTSHGQGTGTARVLQDSEEAGAFAGLAMGLTALATAILLPVIVFVLT